MHCFDCVNRTHNGEEYFVEINLNIRSVEDDKF